MRIEYRGTHVTEHCGTPKITRRWRKLGEGASWFCSCGKQFRLHYRSCYEWWEWVPVEVRLAADALTRERAWAEMTETLHHDENTMVKVFRALRAAGLDKERCFDAVTEMQNAGILFRERPAIDEEGGGR